MNLDIKGDKVLWEKIYIPGTGNVLLVDETYYDGIVYYIESLEKRLSKSESQNECFHDLIYVKAKLENLNS